MRINRDKATPRRFEIEGRRLIISPSFQPFETQVHKKKKKLKNKGKTNVWTNLLFHRWPKFVENARVCVWEACETTRFTRKMDSIAEKG